MTDIVVLDAAAFDVLGTARGRRLHAFLRRWVEQGDDVWCAAVTMAEVCRGAARTRHVENVMVRDLGGRRVRIEPTDERLAKLVGAILHDSGMGSQHIADAHVVALGAGASNTLVLTADPDDIRQLAAAVPGTRVVTRDPATLI
ncbi:MAG: PIN domain-containing protein [Pseudonocardia sp.]